MKKNIRCWCWLSLVEALIIYDMYKEQEKKAPNAQKEAMFSKSIAAPDQAFVLKVSEFPEPLQPRTPRKYSCPREGKAKEMSRRPAGAHFCHIVPRGRLGREGGAVIDFFFCFWTICSRIKTNKCRSHRGAAWLPPQDRLDASRKPAHQHKERQDVRDEKS